jgi:very-short-patch-repair endonuclease
MPTFPLDEGYKGPKRRDLSRQFRREPTSAERRFWDLVRDRRFDGHRFRRQHPLGTYIADFYCSELRLAVEIDGPIHDAQRDADRERDANLATFGVHVFRITNAEALGDSASILQRLRDYIARLGEGLTP